MENRLLLESDVIRAVDKHTVDDRLDNDISCILKEVKTATVELPSILLENKPVQKQKRVQIFENKDVVLEQRDNKYYLSLYDNEGKFQREVTIDVKDNYEVELRNCK